LAREGGGVAAALGLEDVQAEVRRRRWSLKTAGEDEGARA